MFHVIINPTSRSGRALTLWQSVEHCFQEADTAYKVYFSKYQGHIEEICRELTSDGQDVKLVIFGGDGTVNEAINGIQDFSHVQLGYVPTGSSNDLARGLKLAKDPAVLLRRILNGETVRTIDLGIVHYLDEEKMPQENQSADTQVSFSASFSNSASRRFIVSAGIGFDAAICQEVAVSPFKKVLNRLHLGKLIYLAVAIRLILTQKMVPAHVTLTKNTADTSYSLWDFRRFLFIVCMNHPYEGGGFKFCPAAKSNDGLLDLCGVADLNRLMFFYLFPKAYSGGHVGFHGIHIGKSTAGSSITICTDQPFWVHTDGEVRRKAAKISIESLPGVLQLMM